jgi:hypothetical protein
MTNTTYTGSKINTNKDGWLCYFAKDAMNNTINDTDPISFPDKDGDKVADLCDLCANTGAGKTVDEDGCANADFGLGQNLSDVDADGLPDSWEKQYASDTCIFDFMDSDSDADGTLDGLEDYDNDGANNYKEYLGGTDPCVYDNKYSQLDEKQPPSSEGNVASSETNLVAWILLIFGLLLIIGGSGYLVYYYQNNNQKRGQSGGAKNYYSTSSSGVSSAAGSQLSKLKDKLFQLNRARDVRRKQRQRESVFGAFSTASAQIPHVDKVLSSKGPVLPKLQQAAQKYVEHKGEIKPGLKPEEKGIFAKLESLAKKTQDKDINEVVDKSEAQDIFSKLKDISKNRKIGKK